MYELTIRQLKNGNWNFLFSYGHNKVGSGVEGGADGGGYSDPRTALDSFKSIARVAAVAFGQTTLSEVNEQLDHLDLAMLRKGPVTFGLWDTKRQPQHLVVKLEPLP